MCNDKYVLGIDTSCYTTSISVVDLKQNIVFNERILLDVGLGKVGLQQSEGVFKHINNIPVIINKLMSIIDRNSIVAVCSSIQPRPYESSYMPVFKVSYAMGKVISDILNIPFYTTSHQEGHIMAGHFSAKGPNVNTFLAVHLSGGTSELLYVDDCKIGYDIKIIGNTQDLHAGQFVDRLGVEMGLPFPAGPYLEKLADKGEESGNIIPSFVRNLTIGFSGAETHAKRLLKQGKRKQDIALSIYNCLIKTLEKWIYNGVLYTGINNVLVVGGVSSSNIIRKKLSDKLKNRNPDIKLFFADPELSTDNAEGIALLGVKKYIHDKNIL